jgi:ferredoxin
MLKVDQDKCIGCGLCASTSPENFAMNANGKSEALKNEADDAAKEAANNCPVGAITAE